MFTKLRQRLSAGISSLNEEEVLFDDMMSTAGPSVRSIALVSPFSSPSRRQSSSSSYDDEDAISVLTTPMPESRTNLQRQVTPPSPISSQTGGPNEILERQVHDLTLELRILQSKHAFVQEQYDTLEQTHKDFQTTHQNLVLDQKQQIQTLQQQNAVCKERLAAAAACAASPQTASATESEFLQSCREFLTTKRQQHKEDTDGQSSHDGEFDTDEEDNHSVSTTATTATATSLPFSFMGRAFQNPTKQRKQDYLARLQEQNQYVHDLEDKLQQACQHIQNVETQLHVVVTTCQDQVDRLLQANIKEEATRCNLLANHDQEIKTFRQTYYTQLREKDAQLEHYQSRVRILQDVVDELQDSSHHRDGATTRDDTGCQKDVHQYIRAISNLKEQFDQLTHSKDEMELKYAAQLDARDVEIKRLQSMLYRYQRPSDELSVLEAQALAPPKAASVQGAVMSASSTIVSSSSHSSSSKSSSSSSDVHTIVSTGSSHCLDDPIPPSIDDDDEDDDQSVQTATMLEEIHHEVMQSSSSLTTKRNPTTGDIRQLSMQVQERQLSRLDANRQERARKRVNRFL